MFAKLQWGTVNEVVSKKATYNTAIPVILLAISQAGYINKMHITQMMVEWAEEAAKRQKLLQVI